MPNYKTTVECATYNSVGLTRVDRYTVDGVQRTTRIALYDVNDTFLRDDFNTCQFGSLASDTEYILRSVYYDEEGLEIEGVVPDTEVHFRTKANSFYTPNATYDNGSIYIAQLEDSYWMADSQLISGFGIGVELLDSEYNILDSSFDTPCMFENIVSGRYKVRAFRWTGTQDNRSKKSVVSNTTSDVVIAERKLSVFTFPDQHIVEMHIRLEDFLNPSKIEVNLNGSTLYTITKNVENYKVYVLRLTNLDSGTEYSWSVNVLDNGNTYTESGTFKTDEEPEHEKRDSLSFKDFWISVGPPGAYSKDRSKYKEPFGLNDRFKIKIKHAPYSVMPKIKNVVVQSWKDEDGDDVWLPRITDSAIGTYKPAVTHEAVEYNAKFVIYEPADTANQYIRNLLNEIEGRWLIIWDHYSNIGFEGAYLLDVDDDPKFKRRNYDHVEFTLKFKINGTNVDDPFHKLN